MSCNFMCEYFLPIIVCFLRCPTCLWQYPLYTVMVFDDWKNGIHVVFFVISRMQEQDLIPVFRSFHDRVTRLRANWCPSSIVVDNAQAEINTLRSFFIFSILCWSCFPSCPSCIVSCTCRLVWPDVKIFMCLWHVRKTWTQNIVTKISTVGERAMVLQIVGDIMYRKGSDIDDDAVDWLFNNWIKLPTQGHLQLHSWGTWMTHGELRHQCGAWGWRGYLMLDKIQTLPLSRTIRTSKASSILQRSDSLEDAWIG